jgi:two-component system, NarL family, response regulator NreC
MNTPCRVLLADDHQVVRQGLRELLTREGYQIVAEAANGREAVKLAEEFCPDLAVVDLSMPLLNGVDAAREIMHCSPRTAVILLTMHTEDPYVMNALRAGIRGYVLKSQASTDLLLAIQEVSRGSMYLSPRVSGVLLQTFSGRATVSRDPLSGREREVLQLVAEGKTTKEIAQLLGVSAKTAESHRSRIMEKLDIHETAGLVRYAVRQGLIQP